MIDKVETSETKIALIGNNIEYMKKDITEIKAGIAGLPGVYITQQIHLDFVAACEKRFQALEKGSNLWRWLSPTLSAVLSASVTFLLLQYIQHLK